jgi:hypothetical protein
VAYARSRFEFEDEPTWRLVMHVEDEETCVQVKLEVGAFERLHNSQAVQ